MTRQLFAALLVLMLGSAPISQTLAEGQATVMDLSSTRIGELPEGLAPARTGKGGPAEWGVIEDSTASDRLLRPFFGRRVLQLAPSCDFQFIGCPPPHS